MAKITDLKGFAYPSPMGVAGVVGDLPWHFGTEHLGVVYRSDPEVIASYLPEPLQPSKGYPDVVFVEFGKWFCLWDDKIDMTYINPERTWYEETVIWVGSSFQGNEGKTCVQTYVDNDFTLARGMFMGFNKKFGHTYKTDPRTFNPKMEAIGVGTKMKGWTTAHGERIMEGSVEIEKKIEYSELPPIITAPLFNLRYFPSVDKAQDPCVCDLVKMNMTNFRVGQVWAGKGDVTLYESELEEFARLKPLEILGGYYYENGCTITDGEVLHDWRPEIMAAKAKK